MSPALVVLVLTLLLGLQPIATDLYLPALPAITQGFGASMAQAQLTLTSLLLAFGVSQLAWGPLSDRYGRRPILIWGMALFVVAAIGGAFAGSMESLIVWRTLQGVAMGSAVMCARAVVRDLYAPTEGASMMSKGLTGLGIIACLSAPVGGLLSDMFGWRIALLIAECEAQGVPLPVVCQPYYNLLNRQPEVEILPACDHFGLGVAPYSPIARGVLTGKYVPGAPLPADSRGARGDRRITETELREESSGSTNARRTTLFMFRATEGR